MVEGDERGGEIKGIFFSLLFSFLLLRLGYTSFLFTLPLLAFTSSLGREKGWKVFLPSLIILILYSLYSCRESEELVFSLILDLFVPMSLLAAGYIWIMLKKGKIEVRILLSMLPSFLLIVIIAVMLSTDRALFESVYSTYKNAFVALYGEIFTTLGFGSEIDLFFSSFALLVAILSFPIVMATSCVSFFFYEAKKRSRETDIEERIKKLELSTNTIWVLILLLFSLLLLRFISVPIAINLALISLCIAMLILYAIQGFSVLASRIGGKNSTFKSSQLFFVLIVISLLFPGLNFIVLIALPLLGIGENFFDLKTRRKK